MGCFYKKCKNLPKKAGVLEENEAQIETSKEQGRSMVEMLGVLAIVGVLSVGAISGYRYAMNKYRANQVTNELNLLSHQVAAAMMSKYGVSGTLKLGEPYDSGKLATSGYAFVAGCGANALHETSCTNETKFSFKVSGISQAVCETLRSDSRYLQYLESVDVNENADCHAGTDNAVLFKFDTELSATNDVFVSETGAEISASGEIVVSDPTISGTTDEGEISASVSEVSASVLPELQDGECRSNDDCGADEYCYLGYNVNFDDCANEFSKSNGQCRSVVSDQEEVTVDFASGRSVTYIASKMYQTYWSAQRFCSKLEGNYRMVSLADVGCDAPTHSCAAVMDRLQERFMARGIDMLWTTDSLSGDSCSMNAVHLFYGYIWDFRKYATVSPVCIEIGANE